MRPRGDKIVNSLIKMLMFGAVVIMPTTLYANESEGRKLAELAFSSVKNSDQDRIDWAAFSEFGENVFVSMDANDDDSLSLSEYMSWDYGMLPLAEERERVDAYNTAIRVVFAFKDRDGDGQISKAEHRQSMEFDFQRADSNVDGHLTKDEFLNGHSVMVALRSALDLSNQD